ncbi:MAG TPA: T9SS type A sorting domain-containing protein [Crocinitomix sp.]|nr:T9SS type A sorting domain-containing protein [Crocinitomix sp.]
MKLQLTIFLGLFVNIYSFSQISEGGAPYSFLLPEDLDIENIFLSPPLIDSIIAKDSIDKIANRLAVNIPCQISINTHGSWTTLQNGIKVWRLSINVPKAKGLGLYFKNDVSIPPQSQLFIYNASKTQLLGAYTSSTPNFKAVEVVVGNQIIIEYQTNNQNQLPNLNISEIACFYKGFDQKFNYYARSINQHRENESCEVNVACSEGLLWQHQIDATVLYTYKEGQYTYVCTATIVNNTNFNCKPYILTANHCGTPTTSAEITTNVWYFNYQNPSCEFGSTTPYNDNLSQTMVGGTLKASSSLGVYNQTTTGVMGSDFVLIELSSQIPEAYNPYFAGWNLEDSPSSSGVCIHHPAGSDKKISTYANPIFTTTYNPNETQPKHWGVVWSQTQNGYGVTEGGSSGAALFNTKGQIVGHLSGGASDCNTPTASDLFGKINFAWTSEGQNPNQQLKFWLDSSGTHLKSINGAYYPCSNTVIDDSSKVLSLMDVNIYPNPTINILYIDLTNINDNVSNLTITNLAGQIVYQKDMLENILIIDLSAYAIGTYFVKLKSDKKTLVKKIVKI